MLFALVVLNHKLSSFCSVATFAVTQFVCLFQTSRSAHGSQGQPTNPPSLSSSMLSRSQVNEELRAIRETLFQHVMSDGYNEVKDIIQSLHDRESSLCHASLTEAGSGKTALHVAVEARVNQTAHCIIKYAHSQLLLQEYDVIVEGMSTKKSCLHQLTEMEDQNDEDGRNYYLVHKILNRLEEYHERLKLMSKTTLVKVRGHRPRQLTCLHIAALKGHTDLVKLYIQMGMNVDITNENKESPLFYAAFFDNTQVARELINQGADVNMESDKDSTPLYYAVRSGQTNMVRLLVHKGAEINSHRPLGLEWPLILAAARGQKVMIEIFLKNKADVNVKTVSGETALHYAASEGHSDIIRILEKHLYIEQRTANGDTALLLATKHNQRDAVQLLYEMGAQFTCSNDKGETIWHHAVNSWTETGANLMTLLLSYNDIYPAKKTSPLHLAALMGKCGLITYLLNLCLDPMEVDEQINTFYHFAARYNHVNVLRKFAIKVNVNARNSQGNTALHEAVSQGHKEAIKFLLQKVDLSIKNNDGNTVLHAACRCKHATPTTIKHIVKVMLQTTQCLVSEQNDRKWTALHFAARSGRTCIIEYLQPINPSLKTELGDNALHTAVK